MSSDPSQYTNMESRSSIIVLIQGISESLSFSLKPEEVRRLQSIVNGENKIASLRTFFCFNTLEGEQVAISNDHIQMVNFLDDIGLFDSPNNSDEPSSWQVDLYFRDRAEPYKCHLENGVAEQEDLDSLFLSLDAHPEDQYGGDWQAFLDEDGEPVYFRTGHILAYVAKPIFYSGELDD